MSDILTAITLGIIQGLTEFLPVSSSGHLVIFENIFGMEQGQLLMTVAVHFGTICAVLLYFSRDIVTLVMDFLRGLNEIARRRVIEPVYRENANFRISLFIILGTIPAGIIGLTLNDVLEKAFSSVLAAGCMLLVTATVLLATRWAGEPTITRDTFTLSSALLIGLAQAIAIMPGISRSGSTIAAAFFLKTDRNWAARFSFLLSIPAVLGASLLELKDLTALSTTQLIPIGCGVAAAFVSGLGALYLLMSIVSRGKFHLFAWYLYPAGILTIVYAMVSTA